jgi:hypothetical protein
MPKKSPCPPGNIPFGLQRIFVFETLEARERGIFRDDQQDGRQAIAGTPVHGEVSLP